MDWRQWLAVGRDVVREIRANNITFMAGSIAHSAFLSLLPLLFLVIIIASAVGDEELQRRIVAMARVYLDPAGETLVFDAVWNASERAGASIIGVISLVWGMLRIFRGINTAFDELYHAGESSLPEKVLDSLVVFVVIALATIGVGLGIAVFALGENPVIQALNPVISIVGLMVAFLPMYYVFPEPAVTVREVLPGTVVAAAGWSILEVLFGLYVEFAGTMAPTETLGAVILLLLWLYGAAFVLLLGATVNVVLAGRHQETTAERDEPADEPARQDAVDVSP